MRSPRPRASPIGKSLGTGGPSIGRSKSVRVDRPPSTVAPDTWELRQLKHSIRWTIYVPLAMRKELKRGAAVRKQYPSMLVQETLARWLAEEM
jgi:hypothetical protein